MTFSLKIDKVKVDVKYLSQGHCVHAAAFSLRNICGSGFYGWKLFSEDTVDYFIAPHLWDRIWGILEGFGASLTSINASIKDIFSALKRN